jgi:hypothetical protein
VIGQFALQPKHNDLAGACVAADPDLGVQLRFRRTAVAGKHCNHPAWMLSAGEVSRLDGVLEEVLGVRRDDKGQHPTHGDRAALFAQRDDLLVDFGGGRRRQGDNHGRLHSRPNRWTISNADGGPHVPES